MKIFDYLKKIETLKREITGCDGLIEFYKNKKNQLTIELEKLSNIEVDDK